MTFQQKYGSALSTFASVLNVTLVYLIRQEELHAGATHLSSDQLQQGTVDGQQVNVCADGRLVEGAGLAVQLVQARLAHGVRAAQADGLVAAGVKLIVADGTGQELGPLGRLHRHPAAGGGATELSWSSCQPSGGGWSASTASVRARRKRRKRMRTRRKGSESQRLESQQLQLSGSFSTTGKEFDSGRLLGK